MKKSSIIYILFFFTGLISLIIQIVWHRYLVLKFGGTIYSASIILSVWMAGITFGSYLVNIFSSKIKNNFIVFCISQIILIVYVFIFPLLLKVASGIESFFFNIVESNSLMLLIKIFILFPLLLIPTTILGAGFPLLTAYIDKNNISKLYSINTFGSAAGSIITGFFLLLLLGADLTIIFSGILYLVFIFTVLLLFRKKFNLKDQTSVYTKNSPFFKKESRIPAFIILILFFLSGFSSLSYEIIYNRIMIYFTGNSTFCFTIITFVFITGLAVGAYIYNKTRISAKKTSLKIVIFGIFQSLIAGYHLVYPAYSNIINNFIVRYKSILSLNPYFSIFSARIISSVLLITPTVLLFGFIFPLVLDIFLDYTNKSKVKTIALATAVNTIGSIIGPLITGFFIINIFGVSSSVTLILIINILIALTAFILSIKEKLIKNGLKYFIKYSLFLFIPLLAFFIINFAYMTYNKKTSKFNNAFSDTELKEIKINDIIIGKLASKIKASDRIRFYKEGVFGTVSVVERYNGILHLKINGVGEVPTDYNSIKTFRILGYLPFMFEKKAQSVLTIAFGGGITYGSISNITALKSLENVEICRDVYKAASLFKSFNHSVYEKAKDTLIVDDGRNYISKTNKKYDIIISDSTHPASWDSWVLYTEEFYNECKSKLNNFGIMAQWIPIHKLSFTDYKIILKTFNSIYPNSYVYYTNEYTILIGSEKELILNTRSFNQLLKNKTIMNDLMDVNVYSIEDVESFLLFDPDEIQILTKDSKISRDNKSPLQYAELRNLKSDTRIEFIDKSLDYADNEILKIIMQSDKMIFKKQYLDELFFLNEKTDIIKNNNELSYRFKRSQNRVSTHFQILKNLNYYMKNVTNSNFSTLKKLNTIMPNDFNINLLLGKYYYYYNDPENALKYFKKNHGLNPDPSTYQNMIILLRRMDRHAEADLLLKEARGKYGTKWGIKLENK